MYKNLQNVNHNLMNFGLVSEAKVPSKLKLPFHKKMRVISPSLLFEAPPTFPQFKNKNRFDKLRLDHFTNKTFIFV